MGVMDRLTQPFRALAGWARRSWSVGNPAIDRYLFGIGGQTLAGVSVTEGSALEAPGYFAGVRNVSEDLATLPLIVYRRLSEDRRERAPDFPLYSILHDQPNEEMDSAQFVEMQQAWLMIRRNSFAEVVRTGGGRVASLWPIPPNRVEIHRVKNEDGSAGELVYRVTLPEGQRDAETGQPWTWLRRDQIFHLKAMALDGVAGMSSIDFHAESIGLALALERYGAAFFGNDATPGGVYETPSVLSDQAYARLKKEREAKHQGLSNKHRVDILEEGLKFHQITVENEKAQFIESQRQSNEQMSRINRIPPHMIQDLSRSTNNNIEHQGIEYVMHSIRPWAVRWERGISTQLMTASERRLYYAEFLLEGLMRGDMKTQAETLAIERINGVISADEWRRIKNLNPIEDGSGKVYLVQGAMIPVSKAGEPKSPEPMGPDARVFRPLFVAAAERHLRKEATAVGKAADRLLKADGVRAFESWVMPFYRDQIQSVRQTWMPLAMAIGEAVRGESGPDMGEWAEGYVRAIAEARQKAAQEEMRAILTGSDPMARLKELTQRWQKDEPEKMADREARAVVESARRYLGQST